MTRFARFRTWRQRMRDERGAGEMVLIAFMLSMVLFAGLVVDGGTLFAAKREAQNAALAAARAGANQVDIDSLFTGDPKLDIGEAEAAADDAITASGHVRVFVTASEVEVQVGVKKAVSLQFLGIIGISGQTVEGEAKAQLLSALDSVNEP